VRVSISLADAEALADRLYAGGSKPLTTAKGGNAHLDVAWWRDPPKTESFGTDRHLAALRLYIELGGTALSPLGAFAFPSAFDFPNGDRRLPDKGFVKMCLNAEPAILTSRMMQGHLVFDVTDQGHALLETA
jgi:hypothetical protein